MPMTYSAPTGPLGEISCTKEKVARVTKHLAILVSRGACSRCHFARVQSKSYICYSNFRLLMNGVSLLKYVLGQI